MMAGSDLDLMLLYDHPAEVSASEVAGPARPLAASQWFARLVQTLVAALTAPDAAGALYAIDMRLRPSGNKGPVAVSLAAFRHYHRPGGEAWTWERMALTRARVVAGTGALPAAVEAAMRAALAAAGPADAVRQDAASMRARLLREAPSPAPPFALAASKLRPGGLIDVEFIAQTALLIAGAPAAARPRATRDVLAWLTAAGHLRAADAALLIAADRAWRTILGMLRLVAMPQADPAGASSQALLRAARAAGLDAVDEAALHATLTRLAAQVRALFVTAIGPVGGPPTPVEERRR